MERRVESRFQVASKIRVIVPSAPARILDCDLMDISATGMRILSPGRVIPEEIVAVEVDLRLILAEVRHCDTRGKKFVVGVRRLHEVDKNARLSDPIACVQEMIADLRGHISARDEPDSAGLATRALENIVERDGKVDVASPVQAVGLTSEPVPEKPPEELPVEAQAEFAEVEPVAGMPVGIEVLDATFVEEPGAEAPARNDVLEATECDAEVESPEEVAAEAPSTEGARAEEPVRAVPARVDHPEPKRPAKADLLDAIRSAEAQKATDFAESPKSGRWRIPAAIAAGLVFAAGVVFTLNERRAEAARHASPAVVAEALAATPAAPALPAAQPAVEAPAPVTAVHHAQLKMTRSSWVTIVADGGKPFKGMLRKGTIRDIDFSNVATRRLGGAGGAELTLDGARVG